MVFKEDVVFTQLKPPKYAAGTKFHCTTNVLKNIIHIFSKNNRNMLIMFSLLPTILRNKWWFDKENKKKKISEVNVFTTCSLIYRTGH